MRFLVGNRPLTTCSLAAVILLAAQHSAVAESPFRGVYAGIQGSYDTYDVDIRSSNLNADDLELSGLSGGFYAGVNTAFPGVDRAIVGLEGSFAFNDADGQVSGGGDHISIASRHTYDISGRAGYEVTDNVLLYGRVGWARTRFSGLEPTGRTTLDGIRFGGGAEYAITDNIALRTEFTRTDYERKRSSDRRFDTAQNRLTLGIGYRF